MSHAVRKPAELARAIRKDFEANPDKRGRVLAKLAPPYLTLVISDDVRGFCDWQQFNQWPQSSQW
jgi:hypothetical protein